MTAIAQGNDHLTTLNTPILVEEPCTESRNDAKGENTQTIGSHCDPPPHPPAEGAGLGVVGGATGSQEVIAASNFSALNKKSFDIKFDLSDTDYEVMENIGSGAYGVVCSAVHRRSGERVAIKKIADIFEQLTVAVRTYREIKILRHFKHDNVISIREMLRPRGDDWTGFKDVYIVLDLMESDLHRIICSKQDLTEEHVRYFLYQLLRGLKYIHSANVVHRDLKPSNLLVNENCDLRIGDFGMARGLSSDADEDQKPMTQYVATRWYRAPEMLLPLNYSAAVDMWSVGCILAEMIGRKPLFPGSGWQNQLLIIFNVVGTPSEAFFDYIRSESTLIADYLRARAKRSPRPLRELFRGASAGVLQLLGRMLMFDPRDRLGVSEALADPYLGKYHDPLDEPICFPAFDFSFERNQLREKNDAVSMRKLIVKEIQDYHRLRAAPPKLSFCLQPVPNDKLHQPILSSPLIAQQRIGSQVTSQSTPIESQATLHQFPKASQEQPMTSQVTSHLQPITSQVTSLLVNPNTSALSPCASAIRDSSFGARAVDGAKVAATKSQPQFDVTCALKQTEGGIESGQDVVMLSAQLQNFPNFGDSFKAEPLKQDEEKVSNSLERISIKKWGEIPPSFLSASRGESPDGISEAIKREISGFCNDAREPLMSNPLSLRVTQEMNSDCDVVMLSAKLAQLSTKSLEKETATAVENETGFDTTVIKSKVSVVPQAKSNSAVVPSTMSNSQGGCVAAKIDFLHDASDKANIVSSTRCQSLVADVHKDVGDCAGCGVNGIAVVRTPEAIYEDVVTTSISLHRNPAMAIADPAKFGRVADAADIGKHAAARCAAAAGALAEIIPATVAGIPGTLPATAASSAVSRKGLTPMVSPRGLTAKERLKAALLGNIKIRDSGFGSARVSKPKPITALQVQRQRQEQRIQRAQKLKNKKKNAADDPGGDASMLTAHDKDLLERWNRMTSQKLSSQVLDNSTCFSRQINSSRNERANESKSRKMHSSHIDEFGKGDQNEISPKRKTSTSSIIAKTDSVYPIGNLMGHLGVAQSQHRYSGSNNINQSLGGYLGQPQCDFFGQDNATTSSVNSIREGSGSQAVPSMVSNVEQSLRQELASVYAFDAPIGNGANRLVENWQSGPLNTNHVQTRLCDKTMMTSQSSHPEGFSQSVNEAALTSYQAVPDWSMNFPQMFNYCVPYDATTQMPINQNASTECLAGGMAMQHRGMIQQLTMTHPTMIPQPMTHPSMTHLTMTHQTMTHQTQPIITRLGFSNPNPNAQIVSHHAVDAHTRHITDHSSIAHCATSYPANSVHPPMPHRATSYPFHSAYGYTDPTQSLSSQMDPLVCHTAQAPFLPSYSEALRCMETLPGVGPENSNSSLATCLSQSVSPNAVMAGSVASHRVEQTSFGTRPVQTISTEAVPTSAIDSLERLTPLFADRSQFQLISQSLEQALTNYRAEGQPFDIAEFDADFRAVDYGGNFSTNLDSDPALIGLRAHGDPVVRISTQEMPGRVETEGGSGVSRTPGQGARIVFEAGGVTGRVGEEGGGVLSERSRTNGPESAPLSATLIADWRYIMGGVDLAADLQLESPHLYHDLAPL